MTPTDNPDTIVSIHCYAGDEALVRRAMPIHCAHGCPVIIMSPEDSPVTIMGHWAVHKGKRAYIGADSWTRQHEHLKYLLTFPHQYFLLNDADSFCVSARIDPRLYAQAADTLWSNEVVEPRPHASPYPKIAAQPPYFLTRQSIQRMLEASARVPVHPITPYLDYAMLAWACEAGLRHRAFTELEHPGEQVFRTTETEPEKIAWQTLHYRIAQMGTTFCHPIKTDWQVALCREAREIYETEHARSS
jgi:hypothetical protein